MSPAEPLRVLVVDDDFMVAKIHCLFVEQTPGFVVAGVAHSAADALRLVPDLEPDVVLLDVHLPDESGLEVLARLRAAGRQITVVMVTAERGAEAVRAARYGGAMQYLVKPFAVEDLAERLRMVAEAIGVLTDSVDQGAAPDQASIDQAFGTIRQRTPATRLPKGLSPETADLVLAALRERGEMTASEAGDVVGLSRVTARRYLEHFVETGAAEVRLQYGTAGRPQRRYRAG